MPSLHHDTSNMEFPIRKPLERSVCAIAIAQLLWSTQCDEQGLGESSYEDALPRQFVELGEFVTNLALEPDRAETAIFIMADVIGQAEYPSDLIEMVDRSRVSRRRLLSVAQSAFNALKDYMKDVPPDSHYRDEMCRLLDVVAPKGIER